MTLSHEDIVAIGQLEALYGHAVDWPDQSLLGQVFTEDAVFDARKAGLNRCYVGLPAIRDWFAKGKPPHPQVHLMTNVWVYEEGEQVRVKAKWLVRAPKDGVFYSGDYDDVVERTAAGWRIKHRVATVRDPAPVPEDQ